MYDLIFCGLNFLADNSQKFTWNVKDLVFQKTGKKLDISIKVLNELSKLYSAGFKEFTFLYNSKKIVSVWPRNTLYRKYSVYIIFEEKNMRITLVDNNARCIVNDICSNYSDVLKEVKDFYNEKQFYREQLLQKVELEVKNITSGTNIKESEIYQTVILGVKEYIFLFYGIFPPANDRDGFIHSMPEEIDNIPGVSFLKNSLFFTDIIDDNNFFTYTMQYLAHINENDIIFIYNDHVACFSFDKKKLYYISGITENNLQQKIIDFFKNNYIQLPIEVYNFSDKLYLNMLKWYNFTDRGKSDTISKENFDIGKLGLW